MISFSQGYLIVYVLLIVIQTNNAINKESKDREFGERVIVFLAGLLVTAIHAPIMYWAYLHLFNA